MPALPALFSTTNILDHGHGGVKREMCTCYCKRKDAQGCSGYTAIKTAIMVVIDVGPASVTF